MVVLSRRWGTHNVSAVSSTRIPLSRTVALALACLAVAGFALAGPVSGSATAAEASPEVTIKWNGDTSSASQYQPDRLPSSPHFADFDELSLTVSQTTGLLDQAVRVSVSGFAGTKTFRRDGTTITNAQNYLQAMQCWGDPAAEDFRETCQWGGRGFTGFGDIVAPDNTYRVGPEDWIPGAVTGHDVPFKTPGGESVTGRPTLVDNKASYTLQQYFGAATTNEVTSARVGADGTGFFDFEVQSSITAPQMGCGTAAHLTCWLVVVPRGSHFGGGESCSSVRDPGNNYDPYSYGRPNSIQGGSPINDQCDYWDNRIVVPLEFAPTAVNCTVGSTEVRVIGSQLMIGAMTSWQPSLCQTVKSTFSFATNPDSIARAQVLEQNPNSPSLAFSGYPMASGELTTDFERTLLGKTVFKYAPVAVSSVVIGFIAEPANGRIEEMNLSARLMAKLLTQSYRFTVPSNSSDVTRPFEHLGAVNRAYNYLNQDPEFQALNPTNYSQFTGNPAIVLPGPAGADAIKQVWRWILSDSDAVAFLNGEPDDSGMTVNPYYLPKGDPAAVVPWYLDDQKNFIETPVARPVGLANLDGTPKKLSETVLDNFPKNDQSLVPLQLHGEKFRFDSIQYAPYTDNFLSAARQAFRANPNSKTYWDPIKLNAAGEAGDWVSSGTQLPGDKFMITITDSPSAERYSLSVAGVQVANSTAIVHPDAEAMTNALSALSATTVDGVTQIDPKMVAANGYPMTMVTYAAVNVTKATSAARTVIANMLRQVTTNGQVPGTALGELPAGYVPLTQAMVAQASTAATEIESYIPPKTTTTKPGTSTNGYAQEGYEAGGVGGAGSNTPGTDPEVTTGVDQLSDDRTPASATEPIARNGLLIALGVGLVGFLVAPILFRGRGFL